jgi:hypothetical protein
VVDEVDPRVARRVDELADLGIRLVGDAHETENDVRGDDVRTGQGVLLHGIPYGEGVRLPNALGNPIPRYRDRASA